MIAPAESIATGTLKGGETDYRTNVTTVKGPFCKWYRNPIWWWKMRHLRADIRLLEDEVSPEFSKRMRELEDEAFLRGTGAL